MTMDKIEVIKSQPRFMSPSIILLLFFLQTQSAFANTRVKIQVKDQLYSTVGPYFISFALDSNEFTPGVDFQTFNFSSPRLHTLLRGLSPAILRVGGSPADWLVFDVPQKRLAPLTMKKPLISMTRGRWDDLVNITRTTGLELLFDLNLQLRYGTRWDPSNAIALMDYSQQMGYGNNLHFELGNEPEYDTSEGQQMLTGDQVADAFLKLKALMKTYHSLQNSMLVGPDVVGVTTPAGVDILTQVAKKAASMLSAFTIHQYYFKGGDPNQWTELINPTYFGDGLKNTLSQVQDLLRNSSGADRPLWIGETADCWNSGTPNVTDRFISGFLWLDKLGVAAQSGISVVVRQTLYGYYYSLISLHLRPYPDYWLSLIHKRLVGTEVLKPETMSSNATTNSVKVYAHCTAKSSKYQAGAITLFSLNIQSSEPVTLGFTSPLSQETVDVYLLSAGDPEGPHGLMSRSTSVNGQVLNMTDDQTLPDIKPVTQSAVSGVTVPPFTMAFMVFSQANFKTCRSE